MVHWFRIPLTILIQCNYNLTLQMAGNYRPSSDVIRNLRAGTPGEAGAEARALLSGDPLHTQCKLAVQDTHKGSQSQNQLACTPHICCGFAEQLLSSLNPHLRPGKYKITRQQSLFLVSRDQHPVLLHHLKTKHDSSLWAFQSYHYSLCWSRNEEHWPSAQTFSQ